MCEEKPEISGAQRVQRPTYVTIEQLDNRLQQVELQKGMTSMQCQILTELLCRYEDVFSREEYDLRTFTAIKHQIDTGNAKQIRQPARRIPITFQSEKVEYLQKQLDA